jgi:hypothetical protein
VYLFFLTIFILVVAYKTKTKFKELGEEVHRLKGEISDLKSGSRNLEPRVEKVRPIAVKSIKPNIQQKK